MTFFILTNYGKVNTLRWLNDTKKTNCFFSFFLYVLFNFRFTSVTQKGVCVLINKS